MHVVKMIGLKQKHMVCLLQAELINTDGYLCAVIWVNEWAKPEFGRSLCRETEMKMKNERVSLCLCCSRLSCLSPPCLWYLTVSSWVVSSSAQCTMCSRCDAAHAAGALFHSCSFYIQQVFPDLFFFKLLFSSLIHTEWVRRWSCITDKTQLGSSKNSRAD